MLVSGRVRAYYDTDGEGEAARELDRFLGLLPFEGDCVELGNSDSQSLALLLYGLPEHQSSGPARLAARLIAKNGQCATVYRLD